MRSAARHALGVAAVALSWALGQGVQAVFGFPAPVAGLLILAVGLLVCPGALDRLGPTADIAIRWLPLLFVPVAIGGASAVGDFDVGALATAVTVSVPVGFAVAALMAR